MICFIVCNFWVNAVDHWHILVDFGGWKWLGIVAMLFTILIIILAHHLHDLLINIFPIIFWRRGAAITQNEVILVLPIDVIRRWVEVLRLGRINLNNLKDESFVIACARDYMILVPLFHRHSILKCLRDVHIWFIFILIILIFKVFSLKFIWGIR